MSLGFETRSKWDTNWAVQSLEMDRGLKFWIAEVERLYYVAKTKELISCTATMQCTHTADLLLCFGR